jgi:ABC-type Fe3+-hydroxamate transport system substrate-binding protein
MSMIVQNQTGKFIFTNTHPLRIVSLVPSVTELLHYLGLGNEVAGITRFCVHPQEWFRSKPRVGGTKNVSIQKVKDLHPTLILANKEENVKEQVEELASFFPTYLGDVTDFTSAITMITETGKLTGKSQQAEALVQQIQSAFLQLNTSKKWRALYLIWKNPYMSAGGDTFIHAMLEAAGFDNVLSYQTRYPVVTVDEIRELNPDIIFFSSEPFPFRRKHAEELVQLTGIKKAALVDGEMFSWYGSRMLLAPAYFARLRETLFLNDETVVQV